MRHEPNRRRRRASGSPKLEQSQLEQKLGQQKQQSLNDRDLPVDEA